MKISNGVKNNKTYLRIALNSAKESGKTFKKYFGNAGKVSMKGGDPRDLVTKVDKKIEQSIRKSIIKNFPSHRIVGEEFASHKNTNDLVWYIDPVDGTANFIHGFAFCCISIALWDKKGPLVGVIHNPVMEHTFWAVRGGGAFFNGKRIRVSKEDNLSKAYGGYGWGRNIANASKHFPEIVKDLNKLRTLGTTAMEVALVAKGVYDFHIQAEVKIWDFAAAILILKEAGGKITDWLGKPVTAHTMKLVATNGKNHKKLIETVNKLA